MKIEILIIFLFHLLIATGYMSITSWIFVIYPDPDPVATGLQQLLCVVTHFVLTAVICLAMRIRSVDKKEATITLWFNLGAVVFWTIVYLLLSKNLWDYLWTLRSK